MIARQNAKSRDGHGPAGARAFFDPWPGSATGAADAGATPGRAFREEATRLVEELRDAAARLAEEQRARALGAVDDLAGALRSTAADLARREDRLIAGYATRAADGVDAWAARMRERSLPRLLADAEDFARRRPEWFVAGAAATGFLLGRLLTASAERERWLEGLAEADLAAPAVPE